MSGPVASILARLIALLVLATCLLFSAAICVAGAAVLVLWLIGWWSS